MVVDEGTIWRIGDGREIGVVTDGFEIILHIHSRSRWILDYMV